MLKVNASECVWKGEMFQFDAKFRIEWVAISKLIRLGGFNFGVAFRAALNELVAD